MCSVPSLSARPREKTSDNYFQRRGRARETFATSGDAYKSHRVLYIFPWYFNPNLHSPWKIRRVFSLLVPPRGMRNVPLLFRSPYPPSHPPPLPIVPLFRSLVSLPFRTGPLFFFLKINPRPRFRPRATNTRRYIYFFYCLAPEFPIVSRNLSLHGKFGHAEAGAFILKRG